MDYRYIVTYFITTFFVFCLIGIYCYVASYYSTIVPLDEELHEAEEIPVAEEVPEEYKRLIV